jgi:hypothetical protein
VKPSVSTTGCTASVCLTTTVLQRHHAETRVQVRLKQLAQTPKHGMGQNFLLDTGVMMDIVEAANIQPGDRVLEVRPLCAS